MFDSPEKLALGFVTGVFFGFLLQKGRVAKFEVIVGQFLLRDWTVVKTMGTAVVVGAIGVYALVAADLASLHITTMRCSEGCWWEQSVSASAWRVFGYCPGTSVAGCGEGRRDAMVGVVGMLFGCSAFVAAYPALQPLINSIADWGKVTVPEITKTSPWLWIVGLAVGWIALRFIDLSGSARPKHAQDSGFNASSYPVNRLHFNPKTEQNHVLDFRAGANGRHCRALLSNR